MRRSVPIAIVTCLAFAWAVLWPELARADSAGQPSATSAPPDGPPAQDDATMAAARQHFEAGRNAYNAGDFPQAIREFKAAEALRPSPILAYNIGLANEKLQRRKVAVRYYRRYLEGAPAAPNRAEVEGRITQLEREIASQPAQQPPEAVNENPPPPPGSDPNVQPQTTAQGDPYAGQNSTPPMTSAPPHKKRVMWWVWLLVGIGSAVVVTAIIVGVYFGVRASDPYYYYAQQVPADRLPVRRELYDRNALVPQQQRSAETAPILQIHF
jgi:tetratricopeptide (TPR) repeat protein